MTATQPPAVGERGGSTSPAAGPHWFDEAMRLPGATLDNVSDGSRPDVDHDDQPDDGGDR